jgi:hypothetical protein
MEPSNEVFFDSSTTLEHPSTNSIPTTNLRTRSNSGRSSRDGVSARVEEHVDDTTWNALPVPLTTTRFSVSTSTSTSLLTFTPRPVSADHMRRLSGIQKTLSFPNFHPSPPTPSDDSRPVFAHSPLPNNNDSPSAPLTPTLQPTSSFLAPNRSPSQKRKPPASHSSYGVDSSLGPPPSYSTQRTLSQDRLRTKSSASTTGASVPQLDHVAAIPSGKSNSRDQTSLTSNHLTALPLEADLSSPETIDSLSPSATQTESDTTPATSVAGTNMNSSDEKLNTGLGLDGTHDDAKASSSDETQKSEDLFLNIARTDAGSRPGSSKTDKRRSRISLPFLSGSRPSTAAKSSPMTAQFESSHLTPRSEHPFGKRSSLGQHVPGALTSSSYFDDTRSYLGKPSDLQSNAGSVSQLTSRSRRHSNANVDTLRPPTRSRTSRLASEGLYADRFKVGENVATESTISTTAPSTVWDELDDLKSRIKKLELTGKLPPSSAAAMTSTERPRTATTAATTTMSNSPKTKSAAPPLPSTIEGIPSTVHPLLHEALNNAKSSLNQETYQKLQSTAQDALQLSSMLSTEGYGTNGSPLSPQTERQLRRRTESMCRSLTELAIAMLSDKQSVSSPTARPGSREQHGSSVSTLRARGNSTDAATIDRAAIQSRVQSRLENRRTSLLQQQQQSTPTTEPQSTTRTEMSTFRTPPASVVSGPISSRLSRTSTTTARARRSGAHSFLDGASEDDSPSISSSAIRPVSRAMTELTPSHQSTGPSSYRSLARDRATFSREYTKQHPLPGGNVGGGTSVIDPASLAHRMPVPAGVTTRATRVVSRRTFPAEMGQSPGGYESSPGVGYSNTPTHVPRPPFTISIERRHPSSSAYQSPSTVQQQGQYQHTEQPSPALSQHQQTPTDTSSERRTSSTRRSLGFASRISNVSSRLKAARAERLASATHASSPISANVTIGRGKDSASIHEKENSGAGSMGMMSEGNGEGQAVGTTT